MSEKRVNYSPEYKAEAARGVVEHSVYVARSARGLGVG